MKLGQEIVEILFPGHSHSPDNVVVYFPRQGILFGSCLTRSGNSLGHREDADLRSWRKAMNIVKDIPAIIVVLGFGDNYSPSIVNHTIRLLEQGL
jgi:metallo-beta-lactamase class B